MVVQLADATLRAEQANDDANLLIHMVETTCEVPVRYAAWLMLVRSLAVRMDFDMRVLPADLLTPLVTSHTAMLFRVAKHILGLSAISDVMLVQMQLPGQYGGLFLTNPLIKLQVAHLASMAASWNHTYTWLQQQGLTETAAFTAIDTKQATALLEDLRESNIFLDIFGRPSPNMQPGRMLDFESPPLFPLKTLQGKLTNVLYHTQSQCVYDSTPE